MNDTNERASMGTADRVSRLEEVVTHLVKLWLDSKEYDDPDSKITMEEFYKKEQEHKNVFKKFLHWMAG